MAEKASLKVKVQRFGTFLSMMVMPNIPALIAWGFITSLFLTPGGWIVSIWPHSAGFTKEIANVISPMLGYMIPLLIAFTGGKNVYGGDRGGVVGAIGAMGCFVAAQVGPGIPMILGAMVVGPIGGWLQKKFDAWVQPKVKAGLEMLVNNFSAGFMGLFLAVISYKVVEPFVDFFTNIAHDGVQFLINAHLIPLANLFIEPAKILFLNNAINHGILTPLGLEQAKTAGKSILFLLEANPGPGLGILLAFWLFGKGTAKATAPGAIIVEFIGGIHEIYFPYVMMKPALFLAVMGGGVAGTFTNNILNTGLIAPAAPGSIIAIAAQGTSPAAGGIMNFVKILIAVLVAAAVSFIIASIILKNDKSMVDDSAFSEAQAGVASEKATAKGQDVAPLASGDFSGIQHVIFACDAGMGSSAMGASILRDKVRKAGLTQDVTNIAIANLSAGPDTIVVTQKELADRAAQKAPNAIRYQVDNFMSSPVYDQVVSSLVSAATGQTDSTNAEVSEEEGPKKIKLDRNLIKINQNFATKEEAIRFAGQLLVDGGYVNPEYVPAMIQRNEELSVYMGNSIAIPHGTDEAKKEVLKTGISIVQVPAGVNFGTDADPQIATVLFGIAGIGNEHLDLIQKISIFCSDMDNVAKLADAQSVEEIAEYFED